MRYSAPVPARDILITALVVLAAARAAAAQTPSTAAPISAPTFLTRAAFAFQWAEFFTSDPRFKWNGRVTVDVDVFDDRAWRLNFSADYDAVLGRERRPFDLNQGTYVLDGVVGRRIGVVELAGVARHVSRHLTDRTNIPAISWNVAAARAASHAAIGRTTLEGDLEIGRAMQQAFVDYAWISALRVGAMRRVGTRAEMFARGAGQVVGVNRAIANRGRVCGGRIEGGLRVPGAEAALELVAGYERRIDAFPTDRFRVRAFTLGFRIVGR